MTASSTKCWKFKFVNSRGASVTIGSRLPPGPGRDSHCTSPPSPPTPCWSGCEQCVPSTSRHHSSPGIKIFLLNHYYKFLFHLQILDPHVRNSYDKSVVKSCSSFSDWRTHYADIFGYFDSLTYINWSFQKRKTFISLISSPSVTFSTK